MNKLARAVTKWTKACDKRLARLISYIYQTSEYRQYCYVGNTAQQCRLGLFQDSDFAGDLEDSKFNIRRSSVHFRKSHVVSLSWMCKKQTSVSHNSTEAEIISLDASLRMVGIPALDLWDLVIEVFLLVDSGASTHMFSEKDDSAELDIMRTSRSPTTVMTANGEVQTREEATVNVKEFDLFVTVKLLEETPAVLTLGKLCEEHGYTYHWKSGQNCISSKMTRELIAKNNTVYHLWFLEYQRVLPLTEIQYQLREMWKLQYHKEVEVRMKSFGETRCREVQTLPVRLMNLQWSREHTWNRVWVRTEY